MLINADVALRYVAAPSGAGKTTAAVLYASDAPHPVHYVRVPVDGTVGGFWRACGEALGRSIDSLEQFTGAVAAGRREIIVDDLDAAGGELLEILLQLPRALPAHVGATYLARSRRLLDLLPDVMAGTAVVAPRELLTFTAEEVGSLCAAQRFRVLPSETVHFVALTDGWAFAVAGSLREARSEGLGLSAAYRSWHGRHRLLLAEITARSTVALSAEERTQAERLYAGESIEPRHAATLIDAGLLVAATGDEPRALRPIVLSAKYTPVGRTDAPKATIELFGDFEMTIGGRRVAWVRRRDRHIVAFLALRPDGRATRKELMATFWPEANAQLAAQSLRTACSTIRRALAQVVGYDRVGQYFSAERDVRLHFANVQTSAQRLEKHVALANAALEREALEEARGHFQLAYLIYRGPLLETEGTPAWCAPFAVAYREAIEICAHRRAELSPRAFVPA